MQEKVTYVIKAHDNMFPGKPDLYYYGMGPSSRYAKKTAFFFGPDNKLAFIIEASTDTCAKIVAENIAKAVTTPSMQSRAVRV